MCTIKIDTGGYTLEDGTVVTPDNVENLTPTQINELLNKSVTAWELLMMRKSNHHLVNSINALTGQMQVKINQTDEKFDNILNKIENIDKNLKVTLGTNGSSRIESVGNVLVELWDMHKEERVKYSNRKVFRILINKYKWYVVLVLGVSFGLIIKFHEVVNKYLQSVENITTLLISTSLGITIIGFLLKFISNQLENNKRK